MRGDAREARLRSLRSLAGAQAARPGDKTMSSPYEIITVRCAHCGKLRQETNHWFAVSVENGKFHCAPLTEPDGERPRSQASWHSRLKYRLRKNQEPACGQHCAQRLFERYLAAQAMHQRPGAAACRDQKTAGAVLGEAHAE
ncbi:MAG TPA: hypothetical protein VKW06_01700 [Candidatus Angelobacter sp.]|nr:hypothetical protein [Candidatus Angelobacter sp.]